MSAKCDCGRDLVKCDFHVDDGGPPCEQMLCAGCVDETSECTCNEPEEEGE